MLNYLLRKIHQSYMVVAMACGVVVGAIFGLAFRINYFASPIWLIVVVMLFIAAYFKPKYWLVILMFIAGMILIFFRITNELEGEKYIRHYYGQTVEVKGVIKADAETEENNTKVKIGNLEFGEEEKIKTAGTLYVSVTKNEEIARGDIVVLRGKLSEGFGVYAGYMYRPVIKSWQKPEPGDLTLKIRNSFAERISKLIPDLEAKLGLSYLLGMKSGLPDDLNEKLRVVGLVHIVVASGAHLGILVGIVRKLFGNLSRMVELMFSILFIVLFMTMIGWTPSIMRAGLMTILTMVTWYCGRKMAPWRMILIVAAITLLINSMFLIDLGWLLSFASYAGITIVGPKLTQFFYGNKKPKFIASMILTTISATLMTLPITLYYYGQISFISLLANLLILPTLSWAMGLVFLAGIFVGVPVIETVISFLATKLLDLHILVVSFLGEQRQFLVEISPYNNWVFGIYGLMILLVIVMWVKRLWCKRNYGRVSS